MTARILHYLQTDEFSDAVGFVLPPAPMRRTLQFNQSVREVQSALRYGSATDKDVQEFVAALLMDFRPGEVFQHDIVLAALAVALEHWQHPFAESYLLDLARVERAEFRCSFRVARECLKARYVLPRTQMKTTRYPQGTANGSSAPRNFRAMPLPQHSREGRIHWVRYREVPHAST